MKDKKMLIMDRNIRTKWMEWLEAERSQATSSNQNFYII